jgi:hypothetical protein
MSDRLMLAVFIASLLITASADGLPTLQAIYRP